MVENNKKDIFENKKDIFENNIKYVTSKKALEILGISIVTLRSWAEKGDIDTIRTSGNHRLYNVEKYLNDNTNNNINNDNNELVKNSDEDNSDIGESDIKNNRNRYMGRLKPSDINNNSDDDSNSNSNSDSDSDSDSDNNSDSDSDNDSDNNKSHKKYNICYLRISSKDNLSLLKKQQQYVKNKYPKYKIIIDIGSSLDFNRSGFIKLFNLILDKKINKLLLFNKNVIISSGYNFIKKLIKEHNKGKIIVEKKKKIFKLNDFKNDLKYITQYY